MSSENINISPQNVSGKCDLKCAYNFKYKDSNSTAKNQGVLINLTYDNETPPVLYNAHKYNVSNISISCPSVHIFNGASAAGEILIEHSPTNGGNILTVCIPFFLSNETSSASNLITEIIQIVSSNAPSQGESVNLNISDFNLQTIVPKKPFYSYTAIGGKNDYIVFDIMDAIPLSNDTVTTLSQIIKPFPIPTPGNALFYNSTGPNHEAIGDGIYISCQPTGSSEEETAVTTTTTSTSTTTNDLWDNPTVQLIFKILIGCILFISICLIFNFLYSLIINGKMPEIPSVSSFMNKKS